MGGFLTEVRGFTPVMDVVVKDVGLMGAIVYGVMWRYFQMEDHVCSASLQRIAERIRTDRSTVQRHAKALCEAGYIIDRTPTRRNRPHVYADTGKAKIRALLEASATVAESATTVAESNATVAESTLKIVSKIVSKRHGADAPTPTSQPTADEPVGEELIESYFGPRPERQPIQPTPHWSERQHEAWAHWGDESDEMQRQLNRFGERGRTIQRLGYDLEQQVGIRPLWGDKQAVRGWMSGLATCLQEAGENAELVTQAARELREAELDIANPWSLRKKTASLAARQRTTSGKPLPYSDEWYRQQAASDPQLAAFVKLREMQEASVE